MIEESPDLLRGKGIPPAPSKKCEMSEGSGKGWPLAGSAGSGSFLPSWIHR